MPVHNFRNPRGRLVELMIDSEGISDNRLGDPGQRSVFIYLPEGYDDTDRSYPLFLDLAAFGGSGHKRLSWQAFGESVPQRLDRLVATGAMGPVVTVFPDCFTSLGGNQYVDSPVVGAWESFLVQDLVPRVEAEFRTGGHRDHRAVYGKSSGGYGALLQGMRHADTWSAVACHSGDMAFEWLYLPEFPRALNVLARFPGSVKEFLQYARAAKKLKQAEFTTLMMLAMAASYDPDPESVAGVRLPVDLQTCSLDPSAWQRWLVHDPLRLVEESSCRENLKRLNGLFFDCGSRDQYNLHFGARKLHQRFNDFGIAHRFEEFDDDHSGVDYRLDVSLPYLYACLRA